MKDKAVEKKDLDTRDDLQVEVQGEVESKKMKITGRSAFSVSLSPAGVVVQTAFVAEDGEARALPAVFPNLHYALTQIEELRSLVISKFNEAALIGMQSIIQPSKKEGVDES